jgi:hypothetical protein
MVFSNKYIQPFCNCVNSKKVFIQNNSILNSLLLGDLCLEYNSYVNLSCPKILFAHYTMLNRSSRAKASIYVLSGSRDPERTGL